MCAPQRRTLLGAYNEKFRFLIVRRSLLATEQESPKVANFFQTSFAAGA